jgi:hypothetical protein
MGTVVPALQKLAESNVREFYALEKAAKHLPKILRPRWSMRIEELKATAACMLAPTEGSPASAQRVFIHLLKILNERWFIEMGLFLARYPVRQDAAEVDSLWDLAQVAVHRIVQIRRYRFDDHEIPVCFLECYPRLPQGFAGVYDGVQEFALVSLSTVRLELVRMRQECNLALEPWEAAWIGQPIASDQVRQAYAKWARLAVALFPTPQRLFETVLMRTLIEELRHALDASRVNDILRRDCSSEEYYRQFADLKLSTNSATRAGLIAPGRPEDVEMLGRTISELSAQMTAMAVGPDPRLVLAEWSYHLTEGLERAPILGYLPPHALAAHTGSCLLGGELGLRCESEEPTLALLLDQIEQIAEFSPEKIRLALKSVYAHEFLLGQIDESPFQQIGPDGTLLGPQNLIKDMPTQEPLKTRPD